MSRAKELLLDIRDHAWTSCEHPNPQACVAWMRVLAREALEDMA